MDFDPNSLTVLDLFGNDRTILFHSEPGYRVYLTLLTDGQVLVEEEHDGLEELFNSNAAEAAAFSKTGSHGDMVKVASVPRWVHTMWQEQCNGDPACIKRKLNDPDNAKFRTNGWRV